MRWPGRLERIGDVLLDGAHNPDGAAALAAHVRSLGLPPTASPSSSARSPTRTGRRCSTRSRPSPPAASTWRRRRIARRRRSPRDGRPPARHGVPLGTGGAAGRIGGPPGLACRLRIAGPRRRGPRPPPRPAARPAGGPLTRPGARELPCHAQLRHRLEGRAERGRQRLQPGAEGDRPALRLQGHGDHDREGARRHHHPLEQRGPRQGGADGAAGQAREAQGVAPLHRAGQARADRQGRRAHRREDRRGIEVEKAKTIVQTIKDAKLKVQASIQDARCASPARTRTTCRPPSPRCAGTTWVRAPVLGLRVLAGDRQDRCHDRLAPRLAGRPGRPRRRRPRGPRHVAAAHRRSHAARDRCAPGEPFRHWTFSYGYGATEASLISWLPPGVPAPSARPASSTRLVSP